MADNPYLALLPRPARDSINTGLSYLRASTQRAYLGEPRANYDQQCRPVTNAKLKRRIITAGVGPFRITGFDWCVWSLQHIMADVLARDPVLYAGLGAAGMLCARLVRGSKTVVSNHSWGIPIDLTTFGILDVRGDNLVRSALFDLYPSFHKFGWYWGAEYTTEDAMHWEPADGTFRGWIDGSIPAPVPYVAPPPPAPPPPALVVGGAAITGELTGDGRLIVPARPACAALGLPCEFAPPSALRFDNGFQHGRIIDGRLYVSARDLCVRAGRAFTWNNAEKRLVVGA